jgi:ubiquinone/menaquinone biosynthesis C-methylase UbiE
MLNNYYKNITNYFSKKASQYDLVDQQLYWRLSDELLKEIIQSKIIKLFLKRKKIKVLDAGAGTARWSLVLHNLFKKKRIESYFDLVDITKEMLVEAERKIDNLNTASSMKTFLGNIEDLSSFKDNVYDLSISFYNVLSFVEKPKIALGQIHKKLKKGGICASIVANKYHSYFFSILTHRISELEKIGNQRVRFNENMPYIHCFTPERVRKLYQEVGFRDVEVIGFLNFVYPNIEETKLKGQSKQNKNILKNKKIFNKILKVELQECFNQDIAGRGNTLLVIGKK